MEKAPTEEKNVSIGDAVKVRLLGGKIKNFKIVSTSESDPDNGKISNISPLGKILIGAKKGETRTYVVNGKEFEVEILEI